MVNYWILSFQGKDSFTLWFNCLLPLLMTKSPFFSPVIWMIFGKPSLFPGFWLWVISQLLIWRFIVLINLLGNLALFKVSLFLSFILLLRSFHLKNLMARRDYLVIERVVEDYQSRVLHFLLSLLRLARVFLRHFLLGGTFWSLAFSLPINKIVLGEWGSRLGLLLRPKLVSFFLKHFVPLNLLLKFLINNFLL